MRRPYRSVAIALFLCAPALALAQQQQQEPAAGGNPLMRGGLNMPFSRTLDDASPFNRSAIARPVPRVTPVTPVPEPSEWLMLLAGLGVVGVIARRAARRS